MESVEAVDGEIRITTTWGGVRRYVFIPRDTVVADAGESLSRDDAVRFVSNNLPRYRIEAENQHGSNNPVQMVELTRTR